MSDKWQHLDPTRLAQFHAAYLDDPGATAGPCCDWLAEAECALSDVLLLFHAGKVGALVLAQWCANGGDRQRAELVRDAWVKTWSKLLVLRLFPDVAVTVTATVPERVMLSFRREEAERHVNEKLRAAGFSFGVGRLLHHVHDKANRVFAYNQTLPASELTVAEPWPAVLPAQDDPIYRELREWQAELNSRITRPLGVPRQAMSGGTSTYHTDPYR